DVQQVEGELAGAGIAYQTTADGLGVQVSSELVDKARMEIAAKGMPQTGRMGFELFDKPNWVGSEFDEKVNYQRALEGELEHTIETIAVVRSARVHLVMPKESIFQSEQEPAKASVVLKLKSSSLRNGESDSIRNLVAGAVEGLEPDQVTLVDADGRVNLNAPDRMQAGSNEEQALEQKLVAMLEPLAGRDNVRATVNILYDQGTTERTDEIVDPSQVVALTTQKTDQSFASPVARAAGIPGTVSNTAGKVDPGTAAAAAQVKSKQAGTLPVYPTTTQNGQTQHEENNTFAVSKHLLHEEQGPGRIVRVTAAVLVNDRSVPGVNHDGQSRVWRARTPEEMKRLEDLAEAAIGFDAKRGDSVALENVSFESNAPEVKVVGFAKVSDEAQSFLRTQPELIREVGFGVLALLLVLMVVRPVARGLVTMMEEPKALGAGAGYSAPLLTGDVQADAVERALPVAMDRQGLLEHVGKHIRNAPMQSTRLLEAWIEDNGGRA
ncbi:MAG: flagellar basal-body MS-ring/collar protein FliF, partial [Bryocella sp.]